ncbi:TPA: transposase [Salmonella enterica subsp. enterica serovar Newport]
MFQLGIDVSKKTLDLCLLREGIKGRVKTRKLKNDFSAASSVISWLNKQHCEAVEVRIIMEAIGVYHESLAYGLHKAGVRVSLANPHSSRVFARGMGMLTKNDQVDAYPATVPLKSLNRGHLRLKTFVILAHFYVAAMRLSLIAPVKKTDGRNVGLRTAPCYQ